MKIDRFLGRMVFASLAALAMTQAAPANAQTVKIGLISTYSGPNAQYGENIERGLRSKMLHGAGTELQPMPGTGARASNSWEDHR